MATYTHLVIILILILWMEVLTLIQASLTIYGADNPPSRLFLGDAILAYQLEAPDININLQHGSSSSSNEQLIFTNSVDFATTSTVLTSLQQELHPTVSTYPVMGAAIVPVYRIDALGEFAPAIIFTREVLAQIYAGYITWWNDTRIQNANPGVKMPNASITMVIDSVASVNNLVFIDALCKFYVPICSKVEPSTLPAWPISNYANYVMTTGGTDIATLVTTIDNSIGYTILATALDCAANIGSMVNKAQYTVVASSSSVDFAMVELATSEIYLNDASGASAWPINVMTYLMIDRETTRDTCAIRQATVKFWLYIYQSSVVTSLAEQREYAVLSNLLMNVFNSVNDLQSEILCEGQVVVTTAPAQQIVVGGTDHLSFLLGMLINLYNENTSTSVDYTYSPIDSQVAWDKLANAELDIAIFYQEELDSATLATLESSEELLIIPAFLTSIAIIFNPQITPTVNIGTESLVLDFPTYIRILALNITDWKDPAILKYNPFLKSKLGDQSAPIMSIVGCESSQSAPLYNQLSLWAQKYGATFEPTLTQLLEFLASNPNITNGLESCTSIPGYNFVFSPDEDTIDNLVSAITGAVGYTQDRGSIISNTFTLMYPRKTGYEVQLFATSSSPDAMLACASDTFIDSRLPIDPQDSQNPECWPLTLVASLGVRSSYTGTATDTSGCSSGLEALQCAQWLMTFGALNLTTTTQSSPRPTMLSNIQIAVVNALDSVTCDGITMLVTLPVIWSLTSAVSGFGIAISTIGLIGITIGLILVTIYRNHPSMRSTSPSFVFTSLLGISLMFIATLFWVSQATITNCNAFSWCLNLGFTLTFAPLFAKTWRIYRIFGRRKLSVIKISNRKLWLIVIGLISAEIAILSTWQGVGPLQTVMITQVIGSPAIEHQYTQCGTIGEGSSFLIVIGVTKSILLLYGSLLAFSTRRVTDHFNESQSIALAIYNVVFSGGIIILIILFIQPVGDTMIILVLLVTLWVSYTTTLLIMIPKLINIFSSLNQAEISITKSSFGGFSFLSVAEMAEPVLLTQYQLALKEQLRQVTQKLEQIGKNPTKLEKSVLSSTQDFRVGKIELSPTTSKAFIAKSPKLNTTTNPIASHRVTSPSLATRNKYQGSESISENTNKSFIGEKGLVSPSVRGSRSSLIEKQEAKQLLPGQSDNTT